MNRIMLPTFFNAEVRLVPVTIGFEDFANGDMFVKTNGNKLSIRGAGYWNMSIWTLQARTSNEDVVRSIKMMNTIIGGKPHEGSLSIVQDLASYHRAFPEDFSAGSTVLASGEKVDDCYVGCMTDAESNSELHLIDNSSGEWMPGKSFVVLWKQMAQSR